MLLSRAAFFGLETGTASASAGAARGAEASAAEVAARYGVHRVRDYIDTLWRVTSPLQWGSAYPRQGGWPLPEWVPGRCLSVRGAPADHPRPISSELRTPVIPYRWREPRCGTICPSPR